MRSPGASTADLLAGGSSWHYKRGNPLMSWTPYIKKLRTVGRSTLCSSDPSNEEECRAAAVYGRCVGDETAHSDLVDDAVVERLYRGVKSANQRTGFQSGD